MFVRGPRKAGPAVKLGTAFPQTETAAHPGAVAAFARAAEATGYEGRQHRIEDAGLDPLPVRR